jgi:hypothetical protein
MWVKAIDQVGLYQAPMKAENPSRRSQLKYFPAQACINAPRSSALAGLQPGSLEDDVLGRCIDRVVTCSLGTTRPLDHRKSKRLEVGIAHPWRRRQELEVADGDDRRV